MPKKKLSPKSSIAPKKPSKAQLEKLAMAKAIQDLTEKLEQTNKLAEAAHQALQPKVAPKPNIVVEELPNLTLEELKLKLADEIILSWTESTFKGTNSRQGKVFNKLNSGVVQELFKEILSR